MFEFIKRIFVWWHDATLGTSFTMWKAKAKLVGKDEQGNEYYEEGGKPSFPDGRRRRWVVYHGVAEASRVTPDWNGWLHHTFDEPPTEVPFAVKKFEKAYLPNMTGTPMAYHPKG
ncbi:MAG: NADH:ubiquinone oxidoreductase subunit NDUFA12, partial [Pseudomonadota bacterium]